ncbi:MAG: hypothetical protein AB1801_09265 [Chloroflexota bacterium]
MLTSQSNTEFTNARQRAFIEEGLSFFTGRSNDLLSFEEVRQKLRLHDSSYKGLQEIELDKIVGSTGRYRDFTRTFLPRTNQNQGRWRRISAIAEEQGYPPIEVYQVGDVYFVRDGNHRVSVARMNKVQTIEAYVIEFKTPVPVTKDDELDDILLKAERARFFEKTQLDQLRPEQNVEFTEPGRYRLVREHIGFHKYLKETECGCEIPYEEAVASWYDNVYLPVIDLIRQRDVLSHFPGRTEADLYAWLLLHRAELEEQLQTLVGDLPDEVVLEEVTRAMSPNPFTRLKGLFQRKFNWQELPLKMERTRFLAETHLDLLRPGHRITCSQAEGYRLLREHINTHKYLRETETGSELSAEEAVASWYDYVYLPTVELIRRHKVTEHIPQWTEADLYLWLISQRAALKADEQAIDRVLTEKLIHDLERANGASNTFTRLAQFFSKKLHLQGVIG